jgi:molecular chaperone GrpE
MKSTGDSAKAEKKTSKSAEKENIDSEKTLKKEAGTPSAQAGKSKKSSKTVKNVLKKAKDAMDSGKAVSEELNEFKDRFLRLQADFENFRKRTQREKTELYRMANEDILSELLPVLDHMELALNSAGDRADDDPFVQGVQLVVEQMNVVLGKFGLSPVDADSKEFDHNVHEAVANIPSEDVPENVVVAQVRKGYMFGDKLLRAAQVVVSSGPAE